MYKELLGMSNRLLEAQETTILRLSSKFYFFNFFTLLMIIYNGLRIQEQEP
jgi:hypothetical protein